MARCKLTKMNLRNIRKTREYQALLIDLVSAGVVTKSAAEDLLGYTIPAGLLADNIPSGDDTGDDDTDDDTESTVTLLYFDATANDNAGEWETETFTLADDTTEADIIAAAKTAFEDNTIDTISFVELSDSYVEGTSELSAKYAALDPQPEAFANGQFIKCFKASL